MEAGVTQPDDPILVACAFYFLWMMRRELVRREVTMRDRVVMIGIAFVHVLHRDDGRADKPRREHQHEETAAEPGEHAGIMGG